MSRGFLRMPSPTRKPNGEIAQVRRRRHHDRVGLGIDLQRDRRLFRQLPRDLLRRAANSRLAGCRARAKARAFGLVEILLSA